MALEKRGGCSYYYAAQWVNGRTIKRYLGSGPLVDYLSASQELHRIQRDELRQAERDWCALLEKQRQELRRDNEEASAITALILTAAGYHQHKRGEWRKKRGGSMEQVSGAASLVPNTDRERREVIAFALKNPKDAQAQAAAVATLKAHPELSDMRDCSSLMVVSRNRYPQDTEGTRLVRAQAEQMRAGLAGDNPTALETMLIDRVVACWVYVATCQEKLQGSSVQILTFHYKRLEAANRMYLKAAKTLAEVRRLQLPTVVAMQINMGAAQPPAPAPAATTPRRRGRPRRDATSTTNDTGSGYVLPAMPRTGEGKQAQHADAQ